MSKTQSPKKRPRLWRRLAKKKRFGLTIRVACLTIVSGLFVVLYFYMDDSVETNRTSPVDDISENSSDPNKLIAESDLLVDDISLDLPNRIRHLQKRIRIADQLLATKNNPDAQAYGTWSKTFALTQLEILGLENGMRLSKTRSSLRELADANRKSSDARIARYAQTAKAICSVLDVHDESEVKGSSDALRKLRVTAIEDFRSASIVTADDFTATSLLFKVAKMSNGARATIKIPELLDLFQQNRSDSEQTSIRDMALEAKNQYLNSKLELTSLTFGFADEVDSEINELSGQIQRLLAVPGMDVDQYGRLPGIIASVVRLGRHQQAQNLVNQVVRKIGNDVALQDVSTELQGVATQLSFVGKPLSIEGIVDLDGQPAKFKSEVVAKVILFVNAERFQECMAATKKLFEALQSLSRDSPKSSLSLVYLENDVDRLTLQSMKSEMQKMDIWRIDFDSDNYSRFLTRFPVPSAPFIILLNRENELICIDPPVDVCEAKVIDLIYRRKK